MYLKYFNLKSEIFIKVYLYKKERKISHFNFHHKNPVIIHYI